LSGTTIVGLVDPGRDGDTLVAKQVTMLNASAARRVAAALVEAASWVGSSVVALERVEPVSVRAELEAALRVAGVS